jgi:hypothetical protein
MFSSLGWWLSARTAVPGGTNGKSTDVWSYDFQGGTMQLAGRKHLNTVDGLELPGKEKANTLPPRLRRLMNLQSMPAGVHHLQPIFDRCIVRLLNSPTLPKILAVKLSGED